MGKQAFIFLIVAMATIRSAAEISAEDQMTQPCDEIVIAAPPEYPPFSYSGGGVLDGAGVALAKMIVEQSGLKASIRSNASWARVYAGHLSGDIDLVAALYRTAEREKKLIFLGSYATEKTVLVLRKSAPINFSTWHDLRAFTGVVVNGDSRGDELDTIIATELKVIRVHSFENVEQLLFNGRVDYALVGEFSPNVTAFDYRSAQSPLIAHDIAVTTGDVYMSLSKQSACAGFADELNAHLKELIFDGAADRLLVQHAGSANGNAIRRQ